MNPASNSPFYGQFSIALYAETELLALLSTWSGAVRNAALSQALSVGSELGKVITARLQLIINLVRDRPTVHDHATIINVFDDIKKATASPSSDAGSKELEIYEAARDIYRILSESYREAASWPDVVESPEIELYLSENERDSTARLEVLKSCVAHPPPRTVIPSGVSTQLPDAT